MNATMTTLPPPDATAQHLAAARGLARTAALVLLFGMVREVTVRDGDHVRKGDTLLVLGDVSVDADANRLAFRVAAERASIARLDAEQAYAPAIAWPPELLAAAAGDPRLAEQIAKEKSLFATRRLALTSQSALLRQQREKVTQESTATRTRPTTACRSRPTPSRSPMLAT